MYNNKLIYKLYHKDSFGSDYIIGYFATWSLAQQYKEEYMTKNSITLVPGYESVKIEEILLHGDNNITEATV